MKPRKGLGIDPANDFAIQTQRRPFHYSVDCAKKFHIVQQLYSRNGRQAREAKRNTLRLSLTVEGPILFAIENAHRSELIGNKLELCARRNFRLTRHFIERTKGRGCTDLIQMRKQRRLNTPTRGMSGGPGEIVRTFNVIKVRPSPVPVRRPFAK